MVITVSVDIGTNVWFFVMVLDAGSDGVRLDGLVLRIGHGWGAEKKGMGMEVDVGLLLRESMKYIFTYFSYLGDYP